MSSNLNLLVEMIELISQHLKDLQVGGDRQRLERVKLIKLKRIADEDSHAILCLKRARMKVLGH